MNQFYTGRFEGSFANGVAFAENPATGDCRVCGSLASLCGLESALQANDQAGIQLAIKRIMLVHSIILSIGGVPLLYAGDELGLLNDYNYENDPSKQHDARWVHRVEVDDEMLAEQYTAPEKLNQQLSELIQLRKNTSILGDASTVIMPMVNQHCFSYLREDKQGNQCLCVLNFSEHEILIDASVFNAFNKSLGLDLITRNSIDTTTGITLGAYQYYWIV